MKIMDAYLRRPILFSPRRTAHGGGVMRVICLSCGRPWWRNPLSKIQEFSKRCPWCGSNSWGEGDKANWPSITELSGSDPSLTGPMSTAEYIKSIREGDDEQQEQDRRD